MLTEGKSELAAMQDRLPNANLTRTVDEKAFRLLKSADFVDDGDDFVMVVGGGNQLFGLD